METVIKTNHVWLLNLENILSRWGHILNYFKKPDKIHRTWGTI